MKIQDIPSNTFLSDAPDLESRLPQDDQSALRLWLRLLSCSTLIENELRSCLRRKFNTTLPRFELMAQLASRPEGMKMTALSRHMLVTNGNITGITDQLEKEGYVKRQRLPNDRRSSMLFLTAKGKAQYAIIAQAYQKCVERFFSALPQTSITLLQEELAQLKTLVHLKCTERA
ncbi:MAG TPA: MarR family transcriptional regulator [Paenalcaligenes sp.]|nr:MarR family transcriptional regulator [Paenalcaligenes sp.]